MGAQKHNDPAERLRIASERAAISLDELAREIERAGSIRADSLYGILSAIVVAPVWKPLAGIIIEYQDAQIEHYALSIAALTGRDVSDVSGRLRHWLRKAPEDMSFLDCLQILDFEALAAQYSGSASGWLFAFDGADD